MPQALLPLIPDGATEINDRVSVVRGDGQWTYFHGVSPVFSHPERDRRSFADTPPAVEEEAVVAAALHAFLKGGATQTGAQTGDGMTGWRRAARLEALR